MAPLPKFRLKKPESNEPLMLFTNTQFQRAIQLVLVEIRKELPALIPEPIKGEKGDRGETGLQGIQGEKGESIRGEKGDRGSVGLRGERGLQGRTGTTGASGKDAVTPEKTEGEVLEIVKPELDKIKREIRKRATTKQIAGGGGGGDSMKFTEVTGDYTLAVNDKLVLVDASAGNVTITLPPTSQAARREYHIKKTELSDNTVKLQPQNNETIDGETCIIFGYSARDSRRLYSTGLTWYRI